jgi:sterol 3beta-glucosyltransferase
MKIYILTIGTRGDVQPYIALGLGLKSVGHEVTIATLKEFDDLVTEYGLQLAPLRGDFLKVAQSAETGSTTKKRGNTLRWRKRHSRMNGKVPKMLNC